MTFTIKIITKGYVQALTMADHSKSDYPNIPFVKVLSLVSKRQISTRDRIKKLGSEIALVNELLVVYITVLNYLKVAYRHFQVRLFENNGGLQIDIKRGLRI